MTDTARTYAQIAAEAKDRVTASRSFVSLEVPKRAFADSQVASRSAAGSEKRSPPLRVMLLGRKSRPARPRAAPKGDPFLRQARHFRIAPASDDRGCRVCRSFADRT